jgi:hypothetical protein
VAELNDDGWLEGLQELATGIEIRVRHELPEHARELIASLGARYVIDPDAPVCATRCDQPECKR